MFQDFKTEIAATPSEIYEQFLDPVKLRDCFPDLYLVKNKQEIQNRVFESGEIKYFLLVTKNIPYELIKGEIIPVGSSSIDRLGIEIILEDSKSIPNKTKLTIMYHNPESDRKKLLSITLLVGISLNEWTQNGLTQMQQAYATSAIPILPSATSSVNSSTITSATITTGTATTSIITTKPIIASIVIVMLVTSGVYIADPEIFALTVNINGEIPTEISPSAIPISTSSNSDSSLSSSPSYSNISVSQVTSTQTIQQQTIQTSEFTELQVKPEQSEQTTPNSSSSSVNESSQIEIILNPNIISNSIYSGNPVITEINPDDNPELARNIAFDDNGNKIIAYTNEHVIQVFGPTDNLLFAFGEQGSEFGQFQKPNAVAIGSIIVADTFNHRIQKFDSQGNFMFSFGSECYLNSRGQHGCIEKNGFELGDGQFYRPYGITTDNTGNIIVADTFNHRIQKFDSQGNFMLKFGENGVGDGQFSNPFSVVSDSEGNILTLDHNVIQIFDPSGNFIAKIHGVDGSSELIVTDEFEIIYENHGRAYKISFEDAVVTFTEQFDQIKCNTNSMIDNPLSVPHEISKALPISELLSRAENLANPEQFDESLLLYYIASQIEPDNVHAWNGIGYSQTFMCKNNSPIDAYQNTLQLDENNINALNGLGFFYTNQVTIQSQGNAPADMIETTTNLSISNYENTLELDKNNINALNDLGTIHTILKQYNEAINLFKISLDLNPERIVTINGIADAQLKSGNLLSAISYYEDTLDIDPNNFDALSGLLLIYIQQDDQEKVSEMIDRLSQFTEQVIESLIAEGEWFLERGSEEETKRLLEKALELDPENENILKLLSLI